MKVRIDGDIFEWVDDEDKLLALHYLLNVVLYKKRHELVITDEQVLDSAAYKKMPQSIRSVIKESLAYSITRSAHAGDCTVIRDGEAEYNKPFFSLEEAIRFLLQPLSVIVENSLGDGSFLLAVCRCMDRTKRLMESYRCGWLQFENAGGCGNVQHFLEARIRFYGGKTKFLHCFVLLDGDRRFPNEIIDKYDRLLLQLEAWAISYHVLEKRCMENYLPDEAMERLFADNNNRAWIKAYRNLSEEQKDYFCIAEGFRKELTREEKRKVGDGKLHRKCRKHLEASSLIRTLLPKEIREFYADVSEGNFRILERGLALKGGFKVTYPTAFEDAVWVHEKSLRQRTAHQENPNELQVLSEKILQLL